MAPVKPLVREVCATPENVGVLRHAVCDLARAAGADEATLGEVALAVSEACGNAVVHAYPDGRPGPLTVEADARDHELRVRVADRGRGLAPRPDSPGMGLGLPLMTRLAQALRIDHGPGGTGTEVRMTFVI